MCRRVVDWTEELERRTYRSVALFSVLFDRRQIGDRERALEKLECPKNETKKNRLAPDAVALQEVRGSGAVASGSGAPPPRVDRDVQRAYLQFRWCFESG